MRTFMTMTAILAVAAACSEAADPDDSTNTGGTMNAGGSTNTGATMNTGGNMSTGGTMNTGGGGATIDGLVINEISAAGDDWIELYNSSSTDIDLSGLKIADDDGGMPKVDEAADLDGGTVPAGGYFFILADQADPVPTGPQTTCDPGTAPCIHTGWGLSAPNGDHIYILDANDNVVLDEPYPANATVDGESWARQPNGTGDFAVAATPTPGAMN